MAKLDQNSPLYYHDRDGAYQCLGCREFIEIPRSAVLKGGQRPEPVKHHPENRMIWVELMELDHMPCMLFADAEMARQAREFRRREKKLVILPTFNRPITGIQGATA